MKFSIIIPIYNEEQSVKQTVAGLVIFLNAKYPKNDYEIILINDGSTDKTKEILTELRMENIQLINHPYNKGYGAALKSGARYAKYDWLIFFDADGQHKPEYITDLLDSADKHDMIVGARQGYQGPTLRQPGKKILTWIAGYLVDFKIPDLNSGLRLVKKEYFHKFEHLYPQNFSLSTTITLAFLKSGLNVKYIPITINKRRGKSYLKISDGFKTIVLIIKLIMLFSPLKIFIPASLIGFLISGGLLISDLIYSHFQSISKSSGFAFITSLLILLFGLLADQVAAIRRELKER